MKITILNGNPDPDNQKFDDYLNNLIKFLELSDNSVVDFKLREMKIRHCRGCFSCWVKTPGQCIYKDDSHDICREYINSDFILFASPLVMGFTSAVLKIAMDKLKAWNTLISQAFTKGGLEVAFKKIREQLYAELEPAREYELLYQYLADGIVAMNVTGLLKYYQDKKVPVEKVEHS